MAISSSLLTCSCTLLLIILISVTATNGYIVDLVCKKTKDPPLCLDALGGPKFRKEPIEGLTSLAFQGAQLKSIDIQSKIEKLLSSPSLPESKIHLLLRQCKKLYDQILVIQFRPAVKAFEAKQWAVVTEKVKPVPGEIDECEKLFNNNSPVHDESKEVRVAAEAILIMANMNIANH
ncbi:hypothetical protein CASFOL_015624 [Castilleja foliolosa]|uniref:Pectinesterase inhibitor domain-containing protein n=1 Tax=Castilleja foliolosa TaxID=1961234 RepID=A0ABD3DE92_9LAMI